MTEFHQMVFHDNPALKSSSLGTLKDLLIEDLEVNRTEGPMSNNSMIKYVRKDGLTVSYFNNGQGCLQVTVEGQDRRARQYVENLASIYDATVVVKYNV